jgi:hypothetical protein
VSRCNVDEASERVSREHWEAAYFCGAGQAIACLLFHHNFAHKRWLKSRSQSIKGMYSKYNDQREAAKPWEHEKSCFKFK